MRGLLLFSQRTLPSIETVNSLIKKITKNIADRKTMQNASTSNAAKFQEKRITPSQDTCVRSFNAALRETRFVKVGTFCCVGSHIVNNIKRVQRALMSICKFLSDFF